MKQFYKLSKTTASGVAPIKGRQKVILSLTTIPSRIDDLWLTLESLLRQSLKPDKIILWVDSRAKADYRKKFRAQISRGLQIEACEDLGPHTKYYYAMQNYPDDVVVTVDDDVLYPENMLKKLMGAHSKNPECICCLRSHRVTYRSNGHIRPYQEWVWYEKRKQREFGVAGFDNFITGVGGVLYPPHCFDQSVFNRELIQQLTPGNDDIWLFANALMQKRPILNVPGCFGRIMVNERTQKKALRKQNVFRKQNDQYIRNIERYFGQTFFQMKTSKKKDK